MIKIIKKKINMSDELKAKINWSCKFNNRPCQIIEGHLRIVEHTNLAYVEPHKVIKGPINKYGMLRLDYLKAHKKSLYTTLLIKGELTNHLISVSKDAETLLSNLIESYKKRDKKLSEKNKEINQLEWMKLMNNYKNTAEEIILKELIYTENM